MSIYFLLNIIVLTSHFRECLQILQQEEGQFLMAKMCKLCLRILHLNRQLAVSSALSWPIIRAEETYSFATPFDETGRCDH